MTDAELAKFLGIEAEPMRDPFIAALRPAKRALFDRMAMVETEIELWHLGLGPKPDGVIVCGCGKRQHR